jgi:hypothetical protein
MSLSILILVIMIDPFAGGVRGECKQMFVE